MNLLYHQLVMMLGLDLIQDCIICLSHAKNQTNAEDKTSSAKMSSKEYYHESKFNWNKSKQKKCYARFSWWKEVMNRDILF
jgi:hypothetical protein